MNAIQPLAKETVRFLNSGQVITDLSTIVKELVENALDAGATSIEVKLVDYGLSAISVKDNGCGIAEPDRKQMAKRFCTSKLESFENLSTVMSYGFRGEALNSICAVSKETQIITKTSDDSVSKLYDLDATGSIKSEKNNVAGIGTMVTAFKPFYNIPVRRQLAQKNAPQTASKIQETLIAYGLIHPKVRFVLLHTQSTVGTKKKPQNWIKPTVADQMEDIKVIFGKHLADMLHHVSMDEPDDDRDDTEDADGDSGNIHLDAVLPIKGSDPEVVCKGDHVYVYINSRPIQTSKSDLKELVSLVKQKYRDATDLDDDSSRKTPFILLNICLPPNQYDVNVEPSKNAVLLHQKQRVLNAMESLLDRIYSSIPIEEEPAPEPVPEPAPSVQPTLESLISSASIQLTPEINGPDVSDIVPTHDTDCTSSSLSTSACTLPKPFDTTLFSDKSSNNTDNTTLTSLATLEDSDNYSLSILNERVSSLQQQPQSSSRLIGANIRSSTAAKLQEWQFQGGSKEPRNRADSDVEEPLFRSPKKPRMAESGVETTSTPNSISDTSLSRHVVSATRRSNREGEDDNRVNSFDMLMTSRERLLRRSGGVQHKVIEVPTQRSLTSYLDTNALVSNNERASDKPIETTAPPRPSTPIQNILQTPLETRRRRQHLTLMDAEHSLLGTLNENMTQDVNISNIKMNYRLHQARMTRFYRIPLVEYKELSAQFAMSHHATPIAMIEHNLEMYISRHCHPSTGTVACQLAVVDTDRALQGLQYQHLVATKDLSDDLSATEEPCNLHLSDQEQQTLSRLAQTNNVVTDRRLVMNGIIVTLPSKATEPIFAKFTPLIQGYDVSDVQEVLWLIQKGEEQVSRCRPRKVLRALKEEVKEKPWRKPLNLCGGNDLIAIEQQRPRALYMLPW